MSSFADNKGKVGEAGYLTITPENKNYHVDYVYQNDIFNLKNDPTDPYKYLFTLKEGENVFEISMYYEEVETSASEIIAPDNETVTVGGTLTDDLDDIPWTSDEIAMYIGWENPSSFGTEEDEDPNVMHIININRRMAYEIYLQEGRWKNI